jgi:hypothetical protein
MNNARPPLLLHGPSWKPDVDTSHAAVQHGVGERLSGHPSLPLATLTNTRRSESQSERWGTNFYNTVVLPLQFFSDSGRASEFTTGPRRLMFAVFQDAVACWFRSRNGRTARKQRLFKETYDWFWTSNPDGLYAFENICDVLKLDPDYIRRGLMRWHPHVQEAQTQPAVRQSFVLIRRSAIPRASVLAAPRLAPRKSGARGKQTCSRRESLRT